MNRIIKNRVAAFILYVLIFFAVWNIADYLYTAIITHGTYTFTTLGNAIVPTVVALVTGYFVVFKSNG